MWIYKFKIKLLPFIHLKKIKVSFLQMNVEQNVSVFGIAEKPYVYFQCQISLLPPKAHQCPKPNCSGNHRNQYVVLFYLETN